MRLDYEVVTTRILWVEVPFAMKGKAFWDVMTDCGAQSGAGVYWSTELKKGLKRKRADLNDLLAEDEDPDTAEEDHLTAEIKDFLQSVLALPEPVDGYVFHRPAGEGWH